MRLQNPKHSTVSLGFIFFFLNFDSFFSFFFFFFVLVVLHSSLFGILVKER